MPPAGEGAFADLKSLAFFLTARVSGDTVIWNDDVDIALEGAFATFGGEELYPIKEEKGARLGVASGAMKYEALLEWVRKYRM